MTEINAMFQNILNAKNAMEICRELGCDSAYLDAAGGFDDEYSPDTNSAGTGPAPSLSALVLRSKGHLLNIDKAPLIAADPMVSGLGSYTEVLETCNTRLIVNAGNDKTDAIKKALIDAGARLK